MVEKKDEQADTSSKEDAKQLEKSEEEKKAKKFRADMDRLKSEMLVELFTGDAMVRGITGCGMSYLRDLKGEPADYLHWGTISFHRGLYKIALVFFQNYLYSINNDYSMIIIEAFNCIGLTYFYVGDLETCLFFLDLALKRNPNDAESLNNLGLVQYEQKNFQIAKKNFELALAKDSNRADIYWNMARTQMMLENEPEALENLGRAIDISWIYMNIACESKEFVSLKNNSKFQELTLSQKISAKEYSQKAEEALIKKDYTTANQYLTYYLKQRPNDALALDLKGKCLYQMNYFEGARDCFKRALAIEKMPKTYNNLGMVNYSLGEYQTALEYFKSYAELEPNKAFVHWNFALTLMQLNNASEAFASLSKAIKLDPKYIDRAVAHDVFSKVKDIDEFKQIINPMGSNKQI